MATPLRVCDSIGELWRMDSTSVGSDEPGTETDSGIELAIVNGGRQRDSWRESRLHPCLHTTLNMQVRDEYTFLYRYFNNSVKNDDFNNCRYTEAAQYDIKGWWIAHFTVELPLHYLVQCKNRVFKHIEAFCLKGL